MRDWGPLLEVLERSDRFLLTTHLFPDGDGLGSALALAGGLRAQGKSARIVVPSTPPARYDFMDPAREIEGWSEATEELARSQVLIVLDCSNWERLGALGRQLEGLPLTKLVIDHHVARASFADRALLDTAASATAEMIYEWLVDVARVSIDAVMAQALYVSLVTETGNFQYSNTTAHVHRIAAELVERGASPDRVNVMLNQRLPARQLKFLARALDTLALGARGVMAWVAVPHAVFADTGATPEDTIGLVNHPRSIEGVELALMFFEDTPDSVKISFRSKSWFDVDRFARQFGGGGHVRAAGALLEMPLDEAVRRVTAAGAMALSRDRPEGGA